MTEILAMCVNLKYLNDSSPSCGTWSFFIMFAKLTSVSDNEPDESSAHSLNRILSMPRSQKFSFLLSPTEFFYVLLTTLHCYTEIIW